MTPELYDHAVKMALDIFDDLRHADCAVSAEVALRAALAHVTDGKQAAMDVLVSAGVPMAVKQTGGGAGVGGKCPSMTYSVNGRTIFIGF